jgi:nitrous oxide reductase accessory protein NosL
MKKLILSTISLLILVTSCSKDASTPTPTPSEVKWMDTTPLELQIFDHISQIVLLLL